MRYAMLICGVEVEWDEMDEAAAAESMNAIMDWVVKWREAGKILPGGEDHLAGHRAGPPGAPPSRRLRPGRR